jgi:hypothetical protein
MELVAGEPITSYCDREQVDIRRRQPPSISWHAFDTTPKTAISDTRSSGSALSSAKNSSPGARTSVCWKVASSHL